MDSDRRTHTMRRVIRLKECICKSDKVNRYRSWIVDQVEMKVETILQCYILIMWSL